MKAGDLVQHRDDPLRQRGTGIVAKVYMPRDVTLVDVYWSGQERTIYGYMPNELRPLDESR